MEVVRGFLDAQVGLDLPAVSIGNFDGVHRGHQAAISSAVEDARGRGKDAVVCTFDPHTRAIVKPDTPPGLLQTLDQRLDAIAALDVDCALVIPFDEEAASVSREMFVERFLKGVLGLSALHVSDGFRFGSRGSGTVDFLRACASAAGFDLTVVPPVFDDGEPVSSTRIRQLIRAGDVASAKELLSRPFTLTGEVIAGEGRGSRIGVPTANLAVENGCLPAPGVYVTMARSEGLSYRSVCNVGYRPTFVDSNQVSAETHLIDFSGDLYGQRLDVELLDRLRGEVAFTAPETLAQQIADDIERANAYFDAGR